MKILIEMMGWAGALLFLIAYGLIVVKRWSTDMAIYHVFNILGGILLTVNTIFSFAWAAAFINFAWAGIALIGLIKTSKSST